MMEKMCSLNKRWCHIGITTTQETEKVNAKTQTGQRPTKGFSVDKFRIKTWGT